MPNTFDWIEINAKDLHRLTEFYQNVFGWEIKTQETVLGQKCNIFSTGGSPRIENISRFGIWQKPKKSNLGLLVYIWVKDMDNIIEKIKKNGGKLIEAKNDFGPGFRSIFSDPEGIILGLFEDKQG